nr:MAG TPA: hypothetical protein [Caudoviricetes sp.]
MNKINMLVTILRLKPQYSTYLLPFLFFRRKIL